MKLKRKIIAAALAASTMLLCSADAFAGVNFGNGDGSDFKHGTEDNGWLLKKDNGSNIYDGPYADLEALRLTVYEAETQTKVYRPLDVVTHPKGQPFIADEFPRYSAEVRGFCCLRGAC